MVLVQNLGSGGYSYLLVSRLQRFKVDVLLSL